MPLFAPADMVDDLRERWRGMWVEPFPPEIELRGAAITHAEWTRVLEESSKSVRT